MYQVDSKDDVVQLDDLPQSSVGAPCPFVIADEHFLVLAYYLENPDPHWDGTYVRVVDPAITDGPVALVKFEYCAAHTLGPPNDEAFAGHPLAGRGLHPYGAFEIKNSSWIRQLERMNSIHEHHKPAYFLSLKHFIFAFHDSTFECICQGFIVKMTTGRMLSLVPEMMKLLEQEANLKPWSRWK